MMSSKIPETFHVPEHICTRIEKWVASLPRSGNEEMIITYKFTPTDRGEVVKVLVGIGDMSYILDVTEYEKWY